MAALMLTCRSYFLYLFIFLAIFVAFQKCELHPDDYSSNNDALLQPTVIIAVLVRNKAHVLPYFLDHMANLDYPKDRIGLWIRNDHSVDNSAGILQEWADAVAHHYHFVDMEINNTETGFPGEKSPCDWTENRFDHVIKVRQLALEFARRKWSDYLLMMDADIVLENRRTLSILMEEKKIIVGPMFNASIGDTYSNFWAGMNKKVYWWRKLGNSRRKPPNRRKYLSDIVTYRNVRHSRARTIASDIGYYQRTPNYFPIVERDIVGCIPVPMVHSALLIDLRYKITEELAYDPPPADYEGPIDDIIIFAHSVKVAGLTMHIVNREYFGRVMIPAGRHNKLEDEEEQFHYVQLEAMVEGLGLSPSPHITLHPRPKDKLGFDQVYLINLVRRYERRERMLKSLDILGIDTKVLDAVDGKLLNDTYLRKLGIHMMPGYADPYHVRPLTMGEIGCFLSHYKIWEDMLYYNYDRVIVFEDDVRFEPYFRYKLSNIMAEVDLRIPNWDLIYLGRKRLHRTEEWVEGSQQLVWPSYSYWTLSYLLSHRGATKLINQRPLAKMVPVDEYLPIMFDRHPDDGWKKYFHPRNLISVSAEPLLVHPTHYTGEVNYFSDTEDSSTVKDAAEKHDEL